VGHACPQLPQLAGSDIVFAHASVVASDEASFAASPFVPGFASSSEPSLAPSSPPSSVASIVDVQADTAHSMAARHDTLSAKQAPDFFMPVMNPPSRARPIRRARSDT
jgi:hypothetical protein